MATRDYFQRVTYTNSTDGLSSVTFINRCIDNAINTWFGQDVLFIITYIPSQPIGFDAQIEVRKPVYGENRSEYVTTMTASQYSDSNL